MIMIKSVKGFDAELHVSTINAAYINAENK